MRSINLKTHDSTIGCEEISTSNSFVSNLLSKSLSSRILTTLGFYVESDVVKIKTLYFVVREIPFYNLVMIYDNNYLKFLA